MKPRYSFSSRHTGQARDPKNIRKKKSKFPEIAKKVLDESDIILQILDARFVNETRNLELENYVLNHKKHLIQVLNKSDLIKKEKIKLPKGDFQSIITSGKNRTGIKKLRDKIKELAKEIEKDNRITVGVLGYPNLGKSTIINLLIGKSSAGTGAEAGFTKGMQKLKLNSDILIFDSPGVIPKIEYSSEESKKITKYTKVGARSYSQVKDPEQVFSNLFSEYKDSFQKHFNISTNSPEHLIEKVGRSKNFLKKGNLVNYDQTSRYILKLWQEGKIKV